MRAIRLVIGATMLASLFTLGNILKPDTSNAAISYTITDLGALPGYISNQASDINDSGQIAGTATSPNSAIGRSFIWQNGAANDIGLLAGYAQSGSSAISNNGRIVGTAYNPGERAYLWQNGAFTDLGTLPDLSAGSTATDVNDAGQVVGWSGDAKGRGLPYRSFLWQNGVMRDLGALPGGRRSLAWGISSSGAVVGEAEISSTIFHAFLWQDGVMTELKTSPTESSVARKINANGQVVGGISILNGAFNSHASLWQDSDQTDLKSIDGLPNSLALGINNAGQIVGWSASSPFTPTSVHATLWQNGMTVDLNSFLPAGSHWVLRTAIAVNEAGQIVGGGELDGKERSFILTPNSPPPVPPSPSPKPTSSPLPSGTASQCFSQTGKCMQSAFADYWTAHGGLPINGYPISDVFTEVLEDGKPYTVQYFERVRMEYHPEAADPQYQVQLGQFGRKLHPADPPVSAKPGYTFFDQTGHNVSPRFLAYWNANGGLPQFGLPLSEEFTETLEDGKPYLVQYFERARFEYHPENAPPNDILLGQFGRKILGNK